MAEPLSPTSSKALMSLNSNPSPSPITTLHQPLSYDKYQPYVLVKGSMEAPWCSNAEQGKMSIGKVRSSLNQDHRIEKEGIVVDEASFKVSSSTIPFELHSYGTDFGPKSKSLPSSPSKKTMNSIRSIQDLRAAIQEMKGNSRTEDGNEPCFDHLPPEPRMNEDYSAPYNQEGFLSEGKATMFTCLTSKLEPCLLPSYAASSSSIPMKKTHGNTQNQPTSKPTSHYPVTANNHGTSQGMEMICSSRTSPKVNYSIPTRQLYQSLPVNNQGTNSNFPGNAPYCPPIHIFSNSNCHPGTKPTEFDSNSDFPPLVGTHTTNQKHNPIQPAVTNPIIPNNHPTSGKPLLPSSPKTTWSQLFNSNRVKANGVSLEYLPNQLPNDKPSITITHDEVSAELDRWSNALVGHVIGAKPPFKLMQQFVERRWKAFGNIELFVLKPGMFIFNFQDEETKFKVLELGPWSYFDKPLILRPWSPLEAYDRDTPELIPIWIKLPHLKLHLWSATTLSKLGSQIGKPLFTDRMTALRQRLAYARICVEVSMSSSFPQFIEILDHDGSSYIQPIEYEWIPTKCDQCKKFGHKQNQCSMNVRQVWRQKVQGNSHDETKPTKVEAPSSNGTRFVDVQPSPNQFPSPKLDPLRALVTSNKFDMLEELVANETLSITPLAVDNALALIPSQSSPNIIESTPMAVDMVQTSPSKMELMSTPSSITPPVIGLNEEDVPLSKAQRKKREKMQHAMDSKNKASKAKSSTPSPPPK